MSIRNASAGELDSVAQVIAICYAEFAPDARSSAEWRKAWGDYRDDMADVRGRATRGATVIVAERGDRIVGCVTYYPPGVDKSDEGWPPELAAVRLLGVLPEERCVGIGRALTEECIRRAREAGAPAVGLHNTAAMAIARGMYQRMGFERVPENDFHVAPELLVAAYRLDLRGSASGRAPI